MSRFWTSVLLAMLVPASQAAIITEQFLFALPTATGHYAAGHTFAITATYDNASTAMYWWNDGPDGRADFGGNDDTLNSMYDINAPNFASWAFFSEADISVSGLLLPAGATAKNSFGSNFSIAYASLDTATVSEFVLQLRSDDIYMALELFDPAALHPYAGKLFFQLQQHYTDADQNLQQLTFAELIPASNVTRTTIAPVSEPATLGLLGLGLFGLAMARRRKQ